jgi:hypothetical protein
MGTPLLPGFNLTSTFFGLDAEHSVRIHELIFDMIWHSNGRFQFDTLYNMPIYLRNFYIKKINQKLES